MSRARDARRADYARQVAARRNSPAHRGLRRRSGARWVPDAVVETSAEVEAEVEPVPIVVAEEAVATTAVIAAVTEPEAEPDPEAALEPVTQVSPYESTALPTDPTPTEAFAIALGAEGPKRRKRWVRWLIVIVLILGAYVALAFGLRNAVPEGTTIEGVPVGTTVREATKTVSELAAVAARTQVTLTAGDNSTILDPASAGLSVDVEATVGLAGGFTLNPSTLWHRLSGEGTDHDVVVIVAEPAFTSAVDDAADELDSNLADAAVTIDGTTATATPGSQAVTVDRAAAREDVLAVWPTKNSVELTADIADPEITTSQANALAATLNAHVFSGPTTLTGPNGDAVIPAFQVAENSTVVPVGGILSWQVDGDALAQFILVAYPKIENEPSDATYRFTKAHKLKVTKGVPGRELDITAVDEAVIAAGGSTSRSAPIPYILTEPDVTAEELPTQDFTSRISSFRTPLTAEPIRTRNLVRAAQLITGTIVKPGERFNLTDTIGPITASNGYYDAHVIVNGVLTTGIGGGLSQMATTTYNAGYFAGYDDIEHRPHSVWFPRYPAGRESTVLNGSINVVYENTTPYAMIMNSYVSGGYLYVDIWSTKYYTVKTQASDKTNFTQPHIVENDAEDCEAKGNGEPGFTITNTRWVYLEDDLVEKRSWTWTYRPDNGIRCTG